MIWIGVDAHKRLHQGVALGVEGVQGEQTVPNTHEGWDQVLRWARQWPERSWAVEGAGSLGRGLAQFLVARGERVHEVSPRWTAQRRRTMRRPGKSDRLDAHAVAQLLREEVASLPRVVEEEPDAATVRLRSRLRDEIVGDLTRSRACATGFTPCCCAAIQSTGGTSQP